MSVGNEGCFESVGPEACQLVTVVDLDDVELLNDAAVQLHLFSFELGQDSLREVADHEEVKLGLGFKVTLVSLDLVGDCMHISSAFEHGAHCLLASLDVVHVSLTLLDLLFERKDSITLGFDLDESSIERAKIVDFALDPVV